MLNNLCVFAVFFGAPSCNIRSTVQRSNSEISPRCKRHRHPPDFPNFHAISQRFPHRVLEAFRNNTSTSICPLIPIKIRSLIHSMMKPNWRFFCWEIWSLSNNKLLRFGLWLGHIVTFNELWPLPAWRDERLQYPSQHMTSNLANLYLDDLTTGEIQKFQHVQSLIPGTCFKFIQLYRKRMEKINAKGIFRLIDSSQKLGMILKIHWFPKQLRPVIISLCILQECRYVIVYAKTRRRQQLEKHC